jgi:hypothetical protein
MVFYFFNEKTSGLTVLSKKHFIYFFFNEKMSGSTFLIEKK